MAAAISDYVRSQSEKLQVADSLGFFHSVQTNIKSDKQRCLWRGPLQKYLSSSTVRERDGIVNAMV